MAYDFGSATNHIIDMGTGVAKNTTHTIYVRFRPFTADTTTRTLFAFEQSDFTQQHAALYFASGTNQLWFQHSSSGYTVFSSVQWTTGFAANSDHVVICTYDGTDMKIYADSDATHKAASTPADVPDVSGTQHVYIGNEVPSATTSANSRIYEVAWWAGTALGSSDRAILGAGGVPTDCSVQPSNYWPFTTNADDAVGDDDGTVTGATFVDPVAPEFVGFGTAASSNSSTALVPGLPTGWAAGDLLILYGHMSNNTAPSTPSGWAIATDGTTSLGGNNTTAQRYAVFTRIAQGGDTAPSVAHTGTVAKIWRIAAFRNVNSATLDAVAASANAASATVTTPALSSTVDHALGVLLGFYEDDPTTVTTPANWSQPSGSVSGTTSGNDCMIFLEWRTFLAAGSLGAPTVTVSGGSFANSVNVGVLLSLEPVPSGPAGQTIEPDPVTIPLTVVTPAIAKGTATLTLAPATVPLATPNPVIAKGARAITVAPATVPIAVNPITLNVGATAISPAPVSVPLTPVTPAFVPGAIAVAVAPVTVPLALGAVEITTAVTLDVAAVSVPLTVGAVSIIAGAVALAPAPVAIPLTVGASQVSAEGAPQTLSLTAVAVPLALPTPAIVAGAAAIAVSPVTVPITVGASEISAVGAPQTITVAPVTVSLTVGAASLVVGAAVLDTAAVPVPIDVGAATVIAGNVVLVLASVPVLLTLGALTFFTGIYLSSVEGGSRPAATVWGGTVAAGSANGGSAAIATATGGSRTRGSVSGTSRRAASVTGTSRLP